MADNTKVMNETHENNDDLLNKDTGEVAREAVRLLRALSKRVDEVDKNTRTLPGFIKAVRNMVAKFTGDLDKDVMEK